MQTNFNNSTHSRTHVNVEQPLAAGRKRLARFWRWCEMRVQSKHFNCGSVQDGAVVGRARWLWQWWWRWLRGGKWGMPNAIDNIAVRERRRLNVTGHCTSSGSSGGVRHKLPQRSNSAGRDRLCQCGLCLGAHLKGCSRITLVWNTDQTQKKYLVKRVVATFKLACVNTLTLQKHPFPNTYTGTYTCPTNS